ncbi:uncharacterized protein LOC118346134 [Juglans regia]|uniref:Uncharacterized protein LOC118346134 n=1 Tax=Juglans regia TaxID=51240 RepID=A0A6P9EFQ0_JUGRE|nr:uncharacterized protein LOC118346134 [Juglans regia]
MTRQLDVENIRSHDVIIEEESNVLFNVEVEVQCVNQEVNGIERVKSREGIGMELDQEVEVPVVKLKKKKRGANKHICETHPDMLAILEPFIEECHIQKWARKLKFASFMSNQQQEGNIWVFWQKNVSMQLVSSTKQHISGIYKKCEKEMLLSFIYASCFQAGRVHLWRELELIQRQDIPWVVGGDFNVIRDDHEKIGGLLKSQGVKDDFNHCIINCGFMEPQEEGSKYSWCNGQEGRGHIWEKLDLILFREVVVKSWEVPTNFDGLQNLAVKLKRLKQSLKVWNCMSFGNIFANISRWEDRKIQLEGKILEMGKAEDEILLQEARKGLHEWLPKEEIFMAQKAKAKWIK